MRYLKIILAAQLLFAASCISYLKPERLNPVSKNISSAVVKRCNRIEKIRCNMACRDGWGFTGYYDSREHVPGSLKAGFNFPPQTRKALLGVYYSAVCSRCSVSFTLNKEGTHRGVSCEEFFQFIEDYNRQCGNCVKTINAGF